MHAAPGETVPPAIIALLAGSRGRDGLRATLLDLVARGWIQLRQPGVLIGGDAMELAGPVMCVVPVRPALGRLSYYEQLLPYERRAMDHLAHRAGAAGEIATDALAGSFPGGQRRFMRAFRHEVAADARARGLISPVFGRFIAAGRPTPAGHAALATWRAAAPAAAGPGVAYAAALGGAPLALFGRRPRRLWPRGSAEFDGRVLRQWEVAGAGGVAQYVAIDDGARARTFAIASHLFETVTPGLLVRARVDSRRNTLLGIQPLNQPSAG
jgi:hypothetical protein